MNHYTCYLRLRKNCMPVQGATRSILCDLDGGQYTIVSNDIFEILTVHRRKTIMELCDLYNAAAWDDIRQVLFVLGEQGWLFYSCDAPEDLMNSSFTWWASTAQISNAIFDCNELPLYITDPFLKELTRLGCRHIQFRFYRPVDLEYFLKHTLSPVALTAILSVSIVLPAAADTGAWRMVLSRKDIRVREIVFSGAAAARVLQQDVCTVKYVSADIGTEQCCGIVKEDYFTVNEAHYSESHLHNSCLYRKISIDVKGNIKNCPSLQESFGNIVDTTLTTVLDNPAFKKYWHITKNQIAVCRDCEFRHICTDCRAYRDNPDDLYSKPLKCGYDPYTAIWTAWSTHPLKQQAIRYYGMENLQGQ